jgi:hypothetical protein
MACYCDTPEEDDQKEIENRCKVRMYFDAVDSQFTREQYEEAKKKNIKLIPGFDDEDINSNLCKICSILTKEQMENISAFYYQIKWPHETLYDWYVKHIEDDRKHND